ncbi:MAG: methyl-accepting chemotaxis protein [Thermodesulfovibrionales bacterium]|nr:methyl-accepting chemotaxis protein [Thermodesulfovibrionales bacterium]
MFRNLTIGKKLAFGFGIVILLLVIISSFTLYSISSTNTKVHHLDDGVDMILYASEIQREVNAIHLKVRKMMLLDDVSKRQTIFKEIEEHRKYYRKRLEELEKLTTTQEGKEKIKNLVNASNETRDANNKSIQLSLAGKNQEAIELYLKEVEAKAGNREKALEELVQFYYKDANKQVVEIHEILHYESIILVVLVCASVLFAILFSIFISKSIRKPVTELNEILKKVADGDLTVDIKILTKDEIGMISRSVNDAIKSIKTLIAESKTISSSLASSSKQLSTTTEEISHNLNSQTERASQIASSAEEMGQTVIDIAKNAANISEVSNSTAQVAKEGKDMTVNTAKEIKVIESSISKLSEVIGILGDRSRQIGEIVTVIKDIADQTNLLALNAAIEAARAGEQGRGFAVVADEVRKLAERTTKATDEIAEMIKGIQTEVDVAEGSMQDATKKVSNGVTLSEKSANTLQTILTKTQELQGMIQQIASATDEMSSVTDHIAQDISDIAEGSKRINSAVKQSAQTSGDIARLGEELHSAIGRFRV